MGEQVYLIVSVDTEEDNAWDLSCRRSPTVENIRYLHKFQNLCEKYAIKPVYLCTQTIAENSFSRAKLKRWQDAGLCDIGTHLHVWTTDGHPDGSAEAALYECKTNYDMHKRLINTLTKKLEDTFGRKMTVFRAGRYGQNAEGIRILEESGYKVDTSVVPGHNYMQNDGGPDFSSAGLNPYFVSKEDICSSGISGILEVPLTVIGYPKFHRYSVCFKGVPFTVQKILRKISCWETLWLRPTFLPSDNITRLCEILLKNKITRVFNFMVHSSEFMPAGSPYFRDDEGVRILLERTNTIFNTLMNNYNAKSIGYDELFSIEWKRKLYE